MLQNSQKVIWGHFIFLGISFFCFFFQSDPWSLRGTFEGFFRKTCAVIRKLYWPRFRYPSVLKVKWDQKSKTGSQKIKIIRDFLAHYEYDAKNVRQSVKGDLVKNQFEILTVIFKMTLIKTGKSRMTKNVRESV